MRRFPLLLLAVLVLISTIARAQASPVQLCVATLQGAGGDVSATGSRDWLIKFLNKQKNSQISPIPLDQSEPADAIAEAKQKNCQYLVTTKLTETHSDSGYLGGLSTVNLQTFYVTVEYKLVAVDDGKDISAGSQKASDRGSSQNAVTATTKKIAEKVSGALKK